MDRVRRGAAIVGWLWFVAVAVVLVALSVLRFLGAQVDIIASNSMAPAVPIDSLAITMPIAADDVIVGDVITFRNGEDKLVMHRVVEVLETGDVRRFRTKGDNNRTTDPLLLHELGVERRLSYSVGGLGPVARAAQPPLGLIWLAGVPAALLGFGLRRPEEREEGAGLDESVLDLTESADPIPALIEL
ncbi:MAG: signal peptidase I [Actinomycetota bacterium]